MTEHIPMIMLYAKFADVEIKEPNSEYREKCGVNGKAVEDLLCQYTAETRRVRHGLPIKGVSLAPSVKPPTELPIGVWVYTNNKYEGLFSFIKFRGDLVSHIHVKRNHAYSMHIPIDEYAKYRHKRSNQPKCQKIFDFAVAERELIVALLPVFSILPQPIGVKILKRILP